MLILLTQLSSTDNHPYLFNPGSGNYSNNVYYISDINNKMRGLSNCMLFLHATTICDINSALYRQGKKKSFNLVKYNPELQTLVEVFIDSSYMPDSVAIAGEEFMLALYGATCTTLYHYVSVVYQCNTCLFLTLILC